MAIRSLTHSILRQTSTPIICFRPFSLRRLLMTTSSDGNSFNHWVVVMEKPSSNHDIKDITDSYIKTLATVVGTEEEARSKIYSVTTNYFYSFGALLSEKNSIRLRQLPNVHGVWPDCYWDERTNTYREPFMYWQQDHYPLYSKLLWRRVRKEAMKQPTLEMQKVGISSDLKTGV